VHNHRRLLIGGMALAVLLGFSTFALADSVPLTLALSPASGQSNILPIKVTVVIVPQTKNTTLTGDLSATLNFTIDPITHQLDSSGITGITYNKQNPGHIQMSDLNYTTLGINTSGLLATAYTLTPPGPVTQPNPLDPTTYQFAVTNVHAMEINQGIINYSGGTYNCGASPLTGLTLSSTGTLTFIRSADSLTSSTYMVGLTMPVNFSATVLASPLTTMSTSGNNLVATGTYTKSYAGFPAYWDTNAAAGLQAGNGTWTTFAPAPKEWNTDINGSNSLYAWTADAGTMEAHFEANGSSAITVSGSVAAKWLSIDGTGYSFTGGTITVGGSGITANESATVGSTLVLSGSQTWAVALDKTLLITGPVSGNASLTLNGLGTTQFSGPISYTGSTVINGGKFVLDNNGAITLGVISGTGNLSIAPNSSLVAASIRVNTLSIGSASGAMAIPEPATLVLLAFAACGAVLLRAI
jgi:autotransporter-associated beta strand protein